MYSVERPFMSKASESESMPPVVVSVTIIISSSILSVLNYDTIIIGCVDMCGIIGE